MAVSAQGMVMTLGIQAGDLWGDGTTNNWAVYGALENLGTNDGLAGVYLDIVGSGGATVTESYNALPTGLEKYVEGGKTKTRSWGFSADIYDGAGGPGLGVGANQDNGNVASWANLIILRHVGQTAGSRYDSGSGGDVEWTYPVLIAYGTFSGTTGKLTASGSSSQKATKANVIGPGATFPGGDLLICDIIAAEITIGGVEPPPWSGKTATELLAVHGDYMEMEWNAPWNGNENAQGWNNPDRKIRLSVANGGQGPTVDTMWEWDFGGNLKKEGETIWVTVRELFDAGWPNVPFPTGYTGPVTLRGTQHYPEGDVTSSGTTALFVPEPGTIALLGLGGLVGLIRRRRS